MTNATSPPPDDPPPAKMTITVYRVNRHGAVTQECGMVSVPPLEGPPPFSSAFPPCQCPKCRTEGASDR